MQTNNMQQNDSTSDVNLMRTMEERRVKPGDKRYYRGSNLEVSRNLH